jgi:polysaccharide pyruvyl transferase WcaK-like protein
VTAAGALARLRAAGSRALGALEALERRRRPSTASEPAGPSLAFAAPITPVSPSEPPGPTIVLLNDCRDQINYGANALVDGLVEIITRSLPSATLLPIPSHWLIDTSFGFGAFVGDGAGLRQAPAAYPAVADQFEAVADQWLAGRGGPGADAVLERLRGADLVVLNGEGSIYRTNLSAVRELFIAWLAKARLGIPTVFVNGSIHLSGVLAVLPAMVRKTFAVLDAVAVREAPSLRNLAEHAPDVAARLFPDSAFVFTAGDARSTAAVEEVRRRIGDRPYFLFDPGTMPLDDRPGAGSALHQLVSSLRQVVPQPVFVASGPADRYIERLAGATDSLYLDGIVDYREWMALVAGAELLVTGRYHNAILAAVVGCPSITLGSTTHKVHGACEMLEGLIGSPYDGTDLLGSLDGIVEQARHAVDRRTALHDELLAACARRRAEVLELGDLVAGALRDNAPVTVTPERQTSQ